MNQCDGCLAGMPIRRGQGAPVHINPKTGYIHMGCCAHLYNEKPVNISVGPGIPEPDYSWIDKALSDLKK